MTRAQALKYPGLILLAAVALTGASGCSAQETPTSVARSAPSPPDRRESNAMKLKITVDGEVATVSLNDSEAARDFASLLPLTLTLKDYASTEKVSDLPRRLGGDHSSASHTPSVGDVAYYAPWGNLAIYYRDFQHSPGLVPLGRIESGGSVFAKPGPLRATFELSAQ